MAAVWLITGKIYLVGGNDGTNALKTLEVYDPEADSWTVKSEMPTARFGLAAVVLNGKILPVGAEQQSLLQHC